MLDDASPHSPHSPRLGRRPRHTLDEVLDAAERLPYDRLTMTALGAELGLATSGLYRYVRDRDDLVAQLTARLSALLPIPDRTLPWDVWMTEMTLGFYDMIVAHPVLADVMSWATLLSSRGAELVEAAETALGGAGLSPRDVVALHTSATNLALLLASTHVRVGSHLDVPMAEPTSEWQRLSTRTALVSGLELLLDGARHRLETARP